MGIRFRCHHCQHELFVKDFLAGKRGKCPECQGSFRVPESDAQFSEEILRQKSEPDQIESQSASDSVVDDLGLPEDCSTLLPTGHLDVRTEREEAGPLPSVLTESPNATWYVRLEDGNQYGPASSAIFTQWLHENRILSTSLIWRDDWPEWKTAQSVLPDSFSSPSTGIPSPLATTSSVSPASPIQTRHAIRKLKQKRNYTILLTTLIVVAVVLVIALAVVLSTQQT
ncbi:MAG: DUF4339 domain-containing protein [Planctomycetales bacterium]|nr:DUF4339 domain-containing protein [Planctomycetales bacterium]